ncbi:spore coat protein [Alteribacillus sp. YIM 98480]|uniref:spore coat protein n=1 Tax=Alteribacillus sp. YIM 98480 TaxID=2606599 RepID=UPI00131B7DA7|nr:spore coat protein [Alteribacillus sp. YIM 98480]
MNEDHLAWHETLELHELVAFQSIGLIKLKQMYPQVSNRELQQLYGEAIQSLEQNLNELLQFFPYAPREPQERNERDPMTGFYAGDLLGLAKTTVRNYAIAITETATPQLREVFKRQLNSVIDLHARVFRFMYQRSYYPSYNLEKLLQNDVQNAYRALNL